MDRLQIAQFVCGGLFVIVHMDEFVTFETWLAAWLSRVYAPFVESRYVQVPTLQLPGLLPSVLSAFLYSPL